MAIGHRLIDSATDMRAAQGEFNMQDNRLRVTMFALLIAGITSVLTTPLATGLGQGERITRPTVSDEDFPT